MARKVFISYKYSEAQDLRDRIVEALGDDAKYYLGERPESPDLTDLKTQTIKKNLSDMIWGSSVTIVILSPNMTESKWIPWEIQYSLKEIEREDRVSRMNGIVAVAMQDVNGSYDWLYNRYVGEDGCKYVSYTKSKLPAIINSNMFNQTPKKYSCEDCKTVSPETGHYISIVKEEEFLKNPNSYIEKAYNKSQDDGGYLIKKEL